MQIAPDKNRCKGFVLALSATAHTLLFYRLVYRERKVKRMKLTDVLALAKMGYSAEDVKMMLSQNDEETEKKIETAESEKKTAIEEKEKAVEEKTKLDEETKKIIEDQQKQIDELKKLLEESQKDNSNKDTGKEEIITPEKRIDELKELFRKG